MIKLGRRRRHQNHSQCRDAVQQFGRFHGPTLPACNFICILTIFNLKKVLFSLLSLLVLLILLATFFCLICRIRKEFKGRKRQKKSRSSEKQLEEAKPLKEGIEEGENGEEEAKGRAKRRKPFGWYF